MELTIRTATPADAPVLADFNARLAFETEHKHLDRATLEEGVAALMADENKGWYLVAEEAGLIVGQLAISFEWSDWRNGWFWWIQSVYVRADARGKGVYKALHRAVMDRARSAGNVVGIRLYVERENRVGQSTYRAMGMEPTQYLLYEQSVFRNQE